MSDLKTPLPSADGRGDFFAIDRRAWAHVCALGLNAAVAYVVLARGTGRDNRTTRWSTNAITQYTGVGKTRALSAIVALERSGAVVLDPESPRDRPKRWIALAHEIQGCEGYPPRRSPPGSNACLTKSGTVGPKCRRTAGRRTT